MTDISSLLPTGLIYTLLEKFPWTFQAATLIMNEKSHWGQAPCGDLGIMPRFPLASMTYQKSGCLLLSVI